MKLQNPPLKTESSRFRRPSLHLALDCAIPLTRLLLSRCEEEHVSSHRPGMGNLHNSDFEKNLCVLQSVCNSGKCVLVEVQVRRPEIMNQPM